jgi:hypothetical protein
MGFKMLYLRDELRSWFEDINLYVQFKDKQLLKGERYELA